MDILQALIMGIVQGLTEWLPVSSSGHLVIAQDILGLNSSENLVFDLVVHMGTLLAVVVFFRVELGRIVWSVLSWRSSRGSDQAQLRRLALLLIIGTIPAAIAGVLFKEEIENAFTIKLVGVALIANAGILFAAWRFGSKGSRKSANLMDAIVIGLFQVVSIVPGISRSGSTIGSGMLRGLEKESAAVFAFLLSVPVLVGAFAYGMVSLPKYDATLLTATTGFVTSFAVGLVSIRYLLRAVKSGKLWIFSIYCVIVGAAVVVLTSL
jgi:undecaprenyl-diphosphatase